MDSFREKNTSLGLININLLINRIILPTATCGQLLLFTLISNYKPINPNNYA